MSLPIDLIKYALLLFVFVVAGFKIIVEVKKIIKKYKGDHLDFPLEVK